MNLGNVSSLDLSLVVPITNSLTLLFTTVTGLLLGEQVYSLSKSSHVVELLLLNRALKILLVLETLVGLLFVTAGICLCVSASDI